MTDPISFTATAIASLAFQKMVEGVGSETGKKLAASATGLLDSLRQKILAKFKGRETVEAAIEKAGTGDSEAIAAVAKYLDVEMLEAPEFAEEIRQLAHEITVNHIEDNSSQVQINHGGTNFQTTVNDGKVYQAETININET